MIETIPSNDLPKIFDRFHRGEITKTDTIFDLTNLKNILDPRGSEHNLESEKGKQKKFTLLL